MCWCDDLCSYYGDCCSDYESVCVDGGSSEDGGGEEDSGGEPDASVSIWDDALLGGTPLSAAEATAFFAPGSTLAQDVGEFTVHQRTRICNGTTGCGPWLYPDDVTLAFMSWRLWIPGPGWSPQSSCFQFRAASWPVGTGTMDFYVGQGGSIGLRLHSPTTGDVDCNGIAGAASTCNAWRSQSPSLGPASSCYVPNPAGSGFDPDAYPSSVILYDTGETQGNRIRMQVLATSSYVYGRYGAVGPADDNGTYTETEYALYGSLDGSALPGLEGDGCEPTTCEAQGAQCGTIADGCGGTLQCGSCSYPYSCGESSTCELPPNCNLQPCYAGATVSYTCCSPGQVTCANGSGCTCYDACF